MASYRCEKCGMGVDASCSDCKVPLVNDSLQVDGQNVQIAMCPECSGKIKSPLCCGEDMRCAV